LKDFTKGNLAKQLLVFTIPVLLGSLFQQLYSIADAIVVGKFISGGALAAVGSSIAVVNFINGSLLGLTTGASIVISHHYGAGEEQKLNRTLSTSMIFLIIVSTVLSVLGYILTPTLLRMLSTPVEIFEIAVIYQRITLIGIVFPALFNMYSSYMRALGDSKHPLYIMIASSILNILLDYIFVAFLGWGVTGVAVATIISQATAILMCVVIIRKSTPILKIEKFVFDKEIFPLILRNSVPAAIQMSTTSLISLSITRLVNSFGELAAAGYSAATRLDNFALLPLDSMSMTLSTFVGQNIGAGYEDRAKKGRHLTLIFMLSTAIIVSSILLLFGNQVLKFFVNNNEVGASEIVRYGWEYISVIGMFYLLHAVFFSFNGFFRGVGDAFIVMVLTISSLSIRALFSYILSSHFVSGPSAIGWAIPIGWALCSLFAWYYYKKNIWKNKRQT